MHAATFVNKFTEMKDNIPSIWNLLPDGIRTAMSRIGSAVANPINSAIGVVNTFIRGINSVASKLGISWRIPQIGFVGTGGPAYFATGGLLPEQEVGGGFVTNRARAIVGEGSTNHPEFVIPTDPRHRSRAQGLTQDLVSRIGLARGGTVPRYATGGLVGEIISGSVGRAVRSVWDGVKNTASNRMGRVGGVAGAFGRPAIGKLISGAGGQVTDWITKWATKEAKRISETVVNVTTRAARFAAGNMTGLPFAEGGQLPTIHQLAKGAVVRGNRGGVLAHIGDGRSDELVQPLDGSESRGKTVTNNFYGDLIFPNVTDGDDVEKFLLNLESLAEAA